MPPAKEAYMHLLEAFIGGFAAGAVLAAIYYRRVSAEVARLRQEIQARAKTLL
jgi:uncharacterized membrane protein YciS (DUF1049 family)